MFFAPSWLFSILLYLIDPQWILNWWLAADTYGNVRWMRGSGWWLDDAPGNPAMLVGRLGGWVGG